MPPHGSANDRQKAELSVSGREHQNDVIGLRMFAMLYQE
jgi:hypothetical protein